MRKIHESCAEENAQKEEKIDETIFKTNNHIGSDISLDFASGVEKIPKIPINININAIKKN